MHQRFLVLTYHYWVRTCFSLLKHNLTRFLTEIIVVFRRKSCPCYGPTRTMAGKEAEQLGADHAESCCAAASQGGTSSGGSEEASGGASSTDLMIEGNTRIGEQRLKERKGGKQSWLIAIAEILGGRAGEKLQNALNEVNNMENTSDKEAKEYVEAQTRFQARMQEFSFTSQSISTFIKATGEALGALARKQ